MYAVVKMSKEVLDSLKNTKFKKMILCKRCEATRNFEGREKTLIAGKSFVCRLCGSKDGHVEYVLPNWEAEKLLAERNAIKAGTDKLKFRFLGA